MSRPHSSILRRNARTFASAARIMMLFLLDERIQATRSSPRAAGAWRRNGLLHAATSSIVRGSDRIPHVEHREIIGDRKSTDTPASHNVCDRGGEAFHGGQSAELYGRQSAALQHGCQLLRSDKEPPVVCVRVDHLQHTLRQYDREEIAPQGSV